MPVLSPRASRKPNSAAESRSSLNLGFDGNCDVFNLLEKKTRFRVFGFGWLVILLSSILQLDIVVQFFEEAGLQLGWSLD